MKLKNFIVLLIAPIFINTMEPPQEPRKRKSTAEEQTQQQKKVPLGEQKLMDINPEEPSHFELLPPEIKKEIFTFLLDAPGQTNIQRLYNAADNIRSYMMVNKELKSFLNDSNFTRDLIKELSRRYTSITPQGMKEAARALGTPMAQRFFTFFQKQIPQEGAPEKEIALQIEPTSFEMVPNEVKQEISKLLLNIPGRSKTHRLYNAAQKLRSFIQNSIELSENELVNGYAIIELAKEYSSFTYHGLIEAAIALETEAGKGWIVQQFIEDNPILNYDPLENVIQKFLFNAINENNAKAVQFLIGISDFALSTDVNTLNNPLIVALEKRNIPLAKLILNKIKEFPREDIIDDLNSPNTEKITPLILAVINNDLEIVQELINMGASVTIPIENPPVICVQGLKILELLLKHGANINAQSWNGLTLLHLAIIKKQPTYLIVEYIQKGAPIHVADNKGITPLMLAVKEALPEVVDMLLKYKASPNAKSEAGANALHMAIESGNKKIFNSILNSPLDINAQTKEGDTPLILAARKGDEYMIEKLLIAQANPHLDNNKNETPLSIAQQRGNAAIIELLERASTRYKK